MNSLKVCSEQGCNRRYSAKGYCMKHYMQHRTKYNDKKPHLRHDLDENEWFWDRVNITDSCWEWKIVGNRGYGVYRRKNKVMPAHRYSYQMFIGTVEKGMDVDHLCNNKLCVFPYHLEVVTHSENIRRWHSKEDFSKEF